MLRAQVSKDRFRVATPARPSPDPAENLKLAFIPGGRPPDKNLRLTLMFLRSYDSSAPSYTPALVTPHLHYPLPPTHDMGHGAGP